MTWLLASALKLWGLSSALGAAEPSRAALSIASCSPSVEPTDWLKLLRVPPWSAIAAAVHATEPKAQALSLRTLRFFVFY